MTYRGDWLDQANYIAHYGVGHLNGGHSGRYPWGSGARPFQGMDSATDKRITKGTRVQNISVNKPRTSDKYMYVSHEPVDKLKYSGMYAKGLKEAAYRKAFKENPREGGNHYHHIYKNEYDLAEDLVSPSAQRRIDAFTTLWRQNPEKMEQYLAENKISRSKLLSLLEKTPIDIMGIETKKYANSTPKDLGRNYAEFTRYFGDSLGNGENNWGRDAYIDLLQKQGYNGVIDDHDFGYAYAPFIAFNPSQTFKNASSQRMNNVMINRDYMAYLRAMDKLTPEQRAELMEWKR